MSKVFVATLTITPVLVLDLWTTSNHEHHRCHNYQHHYLKAIRIRRIMCEKFNIPICNLQFLFSDVS